MTVRKSLVLRLSIALALTSPMVSTEAFAWGAAGGAGPSKPTLLPKGITGVPRQPKSMEDAQDQLRKAKQAIQDIQDEITKLKRDTPQVQVTPQSAQNQQDIDQWKSQQQVEQQNEQNARDYIDSHMNDGGMSTAMQDATDALAKAAQALQGNFSSR